MGCQNCGNHELIIEIYGQEEGAPDPRCVRQLENMGESGQLELTVKSFRYPHDNWYRTCSLEEDLLYDSHKHAGFDDWHIVMGEVLGLPGVTGWLEYTDSEEDYIIVPFGCQLREAKDTDIGVYTREEWDATSLAVVYGIVPVSDASGMALNRATKEVKALEGML